jgi:hypothetical protein
VAFATKYLNFYLTKFTTPANKTIFERKHFSRLPFLPLITAVGKIFFKDDFIRFSVEGN